MIRPLAVAAALTAGLFSSLPASAQPLPGDAARAVVIVLPYPEAEAFLRTRPAALALGVYSESRTGSEFVAQIGGSTGPGPSLLRTTIERLGLTVGVGASPGVPSSFRVAVERAFGDPGNGELDPAGALRFDVAALALGTRAEAEGILAGHPAYALLIGVGERTPVLVGVLGRTGTLRAGDRPRPGIVVPGDLRETLIDVAGGRGRPERVLAAEPQPTTTAELHELARRFESDESTRYELSVAFAASLYGPILLSVVALRLRRAGAAARLAQATACSTAGYVGALFIADGRAWVRVGPVVFAALLGATIPPELGRRASAGALLCSAAVLAVGALIAPFRPTGEPALTLWGAPLEINRLFGLVNHLVALILVGVVGSWALAGLPRRFLVAGCAVTGAVGGLAAVGANFVSVAFVASAAVVAVSVHRHGRLRLRAVAVAALASLVSFASALALSWLGPSSHGSAAVDRIRSRGLDAVGDLVRERVQENLDQLGEQAAWFEAFSGVLLVALVIVLVRALRRDSPPFVRSRTGYAGAVALTVAALVTLLAEDTGVLVAPVIAALAAAVSLIDRTAPT